MVIYSILIFSVFHPKPIMTIKKYFGNWHECPVYCCHFNIQIFSLVFLYEVKFLLNEKVDLKLSWKHFHYIVIGNINNALDWPHCSELILGEMVLKLFMYTSTTRTLPIHTYWCVYTHTYIDVYQPMGFWYYFPHLQNSVIFLKKIENFFTSKKIIPYMTA